MLIDSTYSQFLLSGLFTLRQNEELCDVELRIGNTSIFAHKVVLAALSNYFKAMFTGTMMERDRKTVELSDMDEKSLTLIVNFAYTGNVKITVSNVQSLLICANMLHVTKVVNDCCEFLENQLHPSNCLGFLDFANLYYLENFKKICLSYVCDHFAELLQFDEYHNISKNTLEKILSHDNLNVFKEEEVFKFLEQWVLFDKERRISDFCDLFRKIRCAHLSLQYLNFLKNHNFFNDDFEKLDIYSMQLNITSTLNMKTNPYRIFDEDLKKAKFARRNSDEIIAIGGKDGLTQPLSSCGLYNVEKETWKSCAALPQPRHYMSAASFSGIVFVTGGVSSDGHECMSSMLALSIIENVWTVLPDMSEKRCAHSSIIYDGLLYVLGGYDGLSCLKTVEVYDPKASKWSNIPSMKYKRSSLEAVVVENCIYALGGQDNRYTSSVEKYDINLQTWEMVPAMNSKRINFGAAVVHGYIFVVGGHDGKEYLSSMERYDPITNEWTVVTSIPSARTGLGMSVIKNQIYVFGGHDGTKYLDSALKYDPVKDQWVEIGKMDNARCYMAITDVWTSNA